MYYLGRWMFTIPSLLGSLKSKLKANILKCLFVFCTIFPISSPLFRRLNFQLLLSEATNLLQMQKKFKKVRTAATATFPHTYPMIRVSHKIHFYKIFAYIWPEHQWIFHFSFLFDVSYCCDKVNMFFVNMYQVNLFLWRSNFFWSVIDTTELFLKSDSWQKHVVYSFSSSKNWLLKFTTTTWWIFFQLQILQDLNLKLKLMPIIEAKHFQESVE